MLTVLWAVAIFCIIIFIHEFGHFITAKLSGMTVHEFSIGMGPKVFGINGKKTKYSLRILPLGGYVKLEGEDGESDDSNAFCNKSWISRFLVLFSGALMNIILGFLIFAIVYSSGVSVASNTIAKVVEESPLDNAGLMAGDKIVKLEGEKYSTSVHTFNDINLFVSVNGESLAKVTFERDGKKYTKSLTPFFDEKENRVILGMNPAPAKKGFTGVLYLAFWECVFVIKSVFLSLWWLITGVVPASSVSGPVAIIGEIGTAAKYGWRTVVNFAGFISVNLGVMNLLPIPALDGGRILFLIIEKIRGKAMNPEKEGAINFIFFAILILFMLLVTFSDIKRIF